MTLPDIRIPADLLPADGRFGSGPSKVRPEAVTALEQAAGAVLGTSHRKPAVKDQVKRVRQGLQTFFQLPDGYEIVLGNGGATSFWDAAVHHLIVQRSAHAVFGEFSSKFAAAAKAAPFLDDPVIVESETGTHPELGPAEGVDAYALTHSETSTGVAQPVLRPAPATDALVLVDATSGAGSMMFDVEEVDAYYFSPQKAFGSEGGLWLALLSPAACARIEQLAASDRYVPTTLDLKVARDNSSKDQTYNTPSVSTLFLLAEQIDWLNERGGLKAAAEDCAAKAKTLWDWADARPWASCYVQDPAKRSPVVTTIDLDDAVPADTVSGVLRAHGVVDTEAYRKLGRNQLRIATFPAVDAGDVTALTACIDHVVDAL